MRRFFLSAIFVCLFLVCISTFFGQQRLDGSIVGKVVDADNRPIPGVTITINGKALPYSLTFITQATGIFRFPTLPPCDDYTLTFDVLGFRRVTRSGLRVNVGKTLSVSIVMELKGLEEEVTVVSFSPIIDVRSSKTSVNYARDFIYHIPMSRDLYDVLNSIPGAVSENVNYRRTSFISGGTVRGNQYSVDGVTINDPVVMYPMTNINIDVYEEVEFGLFGHPADVGLADGGFVNIVTKSGGNDYHGGFTAEYFNDKMIQSLISQDDLKSMGLEKPIGRSSWSDISMYLGGPIKKDRVWFFANGRYYTWTQNFNLVSWDDTIINRERVYTQEEGPHEEFNLFGKLTFQLTPEIRLLAMYNLANITEDYYTQRLSSDTDRTATSKWDNEKGHTLSLQANWVTSQNYFLDFRFGYNYRYFPLPFSDYAIENAPQYWDRYWRMYRNNSRFQETYTRKRLNPSAMATIFADDLLGTNHEIKFGIEYEWVASSWDWWRGNPVRFDYFDGDIYSYPTSRSPNRGFVYIYTCGPTCSSSIEEDSKNRFGIFIQDNLSFNDRLTLNLGLRFDTSTGRFPSQSKEATADPYGILRILPGIEEKSPYSNYEFNEHNILTWTHFSPRIGFSYDIFGDGKASVKGSWSRYNEYLMVQYFNSMNPIYPRGGAWYWYDDNYNQLPDADDRYEVYDLPDSPYVLDLENVLDPESSAPHTDEFTLGIEQELARNFSAGLTLIYKNKTNIFEDVNDYGLGKENAWKGYSLESPFWEEFMFNDPGDDGLFGTDDDKVSSCYAELATSPGGRHWFYTNLHVGFRKYAALQFILNKRMSNQWQLLASLVWSKAWGNIGGGFSETVGASENFDTPNSLIFPEGRLDYDRPVNIKVQSTIILPEDFILSGYFTHLSGAPWARSVWVYIPEDKRYQYPGQGYHVITEERGSRRTSPLTTLDLRMEKRFRLSDALRLGGYIDILNVFGWTGFKIDSDPGGYLDYRDPDNPVFKRYSSYGDITAAYGSRLVKVSLRLTF
jgi:hypothetical protein